MGIKRLQKVTRNGQITLPFEYRRMLNIQKGDSIRVTIEGDILVLEVIDMVVIPRKKVNDE